MLPFYPAFLAGMNLVVLADDAFTFLVSWEFMSLTSWALVMAHHRVRDNVRAGYVYLVMASFGTLTLLLAFGLLAGPDGGYAFAEMRATHPVRRRSRRWCSCLALIGAGSKAGLVPLHVWLPLAHPAAPSHVSALMSGVMTKVAVYGFVRIVFDLLGRPAWWWSMVVLALGGITCVMGVLYALMQHDLKRLLAYHTVENIGIIFIGLGLALAFKAHGMAWAAALALTAGAPARLQSFAVQEPAVLRRRRRAHRDRRARHGASRRAHPPHAADRVRVPGRLRRDLGAAAAQRLRLGMADLPGDPAEPATAVMGPEVAGARRSARCSRCRRRSPPPASSRRSASPFSAGRARAAARDGAGDRPLLARGDVRSRRALPARRHPARPRSSMRWRRWSQASSATACRCRPASQWLSIVPIAESRSSYNGLLVFLFIAISASLAAFAIHRFASTALRRAPAWDCGYPDPSPATQYTAAASRSRSAASSAASSSAPASRSTCRRRATRVRRGSTVELRDLVWDALYAPIAARRRLRRRSGSITCSS